MKTRMHSQIKVTTRAFWKPTVTLQRQTVQKGKTKQRKVYSTSISNPVAKILAV